MSKLDEKLDSIASQVAKLKLNQAQIEKEARIVGLTMARYVTAKNSKEEKAIDVLIEAELQKEEK